MKQVNKNFIYNIIYQLFIYIVPLISIPYVSRVLGASNIGIYSYTYSIVYYFMLTAMLGINNYGARTIAQCKDNKKERSEQFFSIYYLQLISTILMILIYVIVVFLLNSEYKNIMLIQMIYLLSVLLDINWFYFGIEKFKLTITRNIIIKTLSLILIFIFVNENSDLWKYVLIMSSCALISQAYLWLYIGKYTEKVKIKFLNIFGHLKKCIILFVPVIAFCIYRVMDKTMIGALAGTEELGFYENAEKIISIPVSIVTALGTVMLPYMSKNANESNEEINKKILDTFELCFFVIFPLIIGLIIISNDFALVFFGKEFIKSGNIIRLLSVSILFTSIANVIRTNYLIPKEKDDIYVKSTIFGAIINLVINLLLIPKYASYGASVGTIVAEFIVMLYQIIMTKNDLNYRRIRFIGIKYFIKSVIMGMVIYVIGNFIDNSLIKLLIQILVAGAIYFICTYKYIKNDFLGKK